MGIKTPRLYRKPSGTYFLRVLLRGNPSESSSICRKRRERRLSLYTADSSRARAIASWANARLEQARDMEERDKVLIALQGVRTWTAGPNGFSAEGEEDSRNLHEFLTRQQQVRDCILEAMKAQAAAATASADAPTVAATSTSGWRFKAALAKYRESALASAQLSSRSARDTTASLNRFLEHLQAKFPELGEDPELRRIQAEHLGSFLNAAGVKSSADDTAGLAPSTLLKRMGELSCFFKFARDELKAMAVDPTEDLHQRRRSLKRAATKQVAHYRSFSARDVETIFEPKKYLTFNRQPDQFWCPLSSLHMGLRASELATARVDDFVYHEESRSWVFYVRDRSAKNANSVRAVPVAEALIHLGLIEYVEHVKRLGAESIFPHRDLSSLTLQMDPSKNISRSFADYLNKIGITDPMLVFHSFRHTVVQALQDGGTPVAESMQIVGHQAQEFALRTGALTAAQARSVHLDNYSHAGEVRLNVDDPISRLKGHLDRCIRPQLDYPKLRKAAAIVQSHVHVKDGNFRAGWSILRHKYTEECLVSLDK